MPFHRSLSSLVFLFLCVAFTVPLWGQAAIGERGSRERDPVLRADGRELFFTRVGHSRNLGPSNADDIWTRTRYADGSWGRALNPGAPVNSFGHDRALALSPDGTRLAVLRQGLEDYIDLLELAGRNWRILDSWPLPEDVGLGVDLTFDPNGQRLVYSARGAGGDMDLYSRLALADGGWTEPLALNVLNGMNDETSPSLAADGRTLYFRRNGEQWFRQEDAGTAAEPVEISARIRQLAFPVGEAAQRLPAIVTRNDLGQEEQLFSQPLPANVAPASAHLVRGFRPAPPPPGQKAVAIAIRGAAVPTLSVRPDGMNRYALFLRPGETLLADDPLLDGGHPVAGSLAAANPDAGLTDQGQERRQLEAGIDRRQRELDRLDAERRKYLLALPQEDPELDRLRDRYYRASHPGADTLPPRPTTAKGTEASRQRYADELNELERMKAKFRRQQEEKLQQRQGSTPRWSAQEEEAARQPAPPYRRGIGEAYTAPSPTGYRQSRADSLRLDATVRNGLYGRQAPRTYERTDWENDLRRDLPRTTPLSPEETARLDAEYQRKLDELAQLKAELRRVNAGTSRAQPAYSAPDRAYRRDWDTKGTPTSQPVERDRYYEPVSDSRRNDRPAAAPATYDYAGREAPAPYADKRGRNDAPGMPAGITFIPNTSYPDGAGYGGLDQLVRQIQQAAGVVEIRIHTPQELDRRSAQLLSEERAVTIRNFLQDQGVNPKHFRVQGFGNNLTGAGGERVEVRLADNRR